MAASSLMCPYCTAMVFKMVIKIFVDKGLVEENTLIMVMMIMIVQCDDI